MATKTEVTYKPTEECIETEKSWWNELWEYTKEEIIYKYLENEDGKFARLSKIAFYYQNDKEPLHSYKYLDVNVWPRQTQTHLYSFDPFLETIKKTILDGATVVNTSLFRLMNRDGTVPVMDKIVLMVFAYYYRKSNNVDDAIEKMKHYIESEARTYSNEDTVREHFYAERGD